MRHIVLVGGLLALLVGCGGGARGAETPQQAVMNMRAALLAGNEEAFLACFDVAEPDRQVLGAAFRLTQSVARCREAVVGALDEAAAADVTGDSVSPLAVMESLSAEALVCDIVEDRATVTRQDQADVEPVQLARRDGGWLILQTGKPSTQAEADAEAERLINLAAVYDEIADAVSQTDMSRQEFVDVYRQKLLGARPDGEGAATTDGG